MIPFFKIIEYANWADVDNVVEFVNILQSVDRKFVDYHNARAEQAAKVNNGIK